MGPGILGWQLLILITIIVAGRLRAIATVFWVIWTLVQVFALPLSILQFGTIWLGHTIASALFPRPAKSLDQKPTMAVSKPEVPVSAVAVPHNAGKEKISASTVNTGPTQAQTAVANSATQSEAPSQPLKASGQQIIYTDSSVFVIGKPEQPKRDAAFEDFARRFRESQGHPQNFQKVLKSEYRFGDKSRTRLNDRRETEVPPEHGELSDSLMSYLESLNAGATEEHMREVYEADSEQGIATRLPLSSDTRASTAMAGTMCKACAMGNAQSVLGLRYCSDCGAFLGMED